MEHYKISDIARFREDFRRLLPDVRMADLTDGLMTAVNRRVTIDIIRLDGELRRLHPDDWERMSMSETITKHYGEGAREFIEAII